MSRLQLLLLCCLLLSVALIGRHLKAASAQTETADNWRFGVIESYESPEEATELGVGWTRVRFQWAEVQAEGPNDWTPRVTDEQIEGEIAAGRMVVGLLIGIPDWARDENRLPEGLWLPHDDPGNTWANFVRKIVSRYEGSIKHWVIWNEPDIRETEIAHTWDGSVSDFAQLQRTAYLVAKEVNPEAVLHLSAFTYWADYYGGTDQYMARLLDEIKADEQAAQHNFYFDVATAHLYFQPNQIYHLLHLFTDIMRKRDMTQPIWLVETNAPPKDDPYWPVPNWTLSVTLDEQAAFMPQAVAAALAAGAERIAAYKLKDTEDDVVANPEPFGLLRIDGRRRPAFTTYKMAARYLGGMTGVERERWDEVGQIRIDQTGQTTTVVFARLPKPQQAQITATDETAVLIDMWGASQPITATNGVFNVDLPPAYCSQSIGDYCMIGGTTYYLVQSADVPPPTFTPSPTHTPVATATVAPPAATISTATPIAKVAVTASAMESVTMASAVPAKTKRVEATPSATTFGVGIANLAEDESVTPGPVEPASEQAGVSGVWVVGGTFLLVLVLGAGLFVSGRRR